MLRAVLGMVVGGGVGAVAGYIALSQVFGVDVGALLDRLDQGDLALLAVVALPLLFLMVRGWIGSLIAAGLLSAGAALAMKLYFQDDAPWEQVATLTTVYAVVAVGVYKLIVSRVLG